MDSGKLARLGAVALVAAGAVGAAGTAMAQAPAAQWQLKDAGQFFQWAERSFPELFPAPAQDATLEGYVLRIYPASGLVLGVLQNQAYGYGEVATGGQIVPLTEIVCAAGPALCAPAGNPDPGAPGPVGNGAASACFNPALVTPGTQYRWHMRGAGPASEGSVEVSMIQDMQVSTGASFAGHAGLIENSGTMVVSALGHDLNMQLSHYLSHQPTPAGPVIVEYGSVSHSTMGPIQMQLRTVNAPPAQQLKYTLQAGESFDYSVTADTTATTTVVGYPTTNTTRETDAYRVTYLGHKTVTVGAGTFLACHYSAAIPGVPEPWDEYVAVGSGLPLVFMGDDGEGHRVRYEMQADSSINGVPVGQYHAGWQQGRP